MFLTFFIFGSFLYHVTSYTTKPPCCRDHLGGVACTKLLHQNTRLFAKRCNSDAEFRLIQCCSSCNINGIGMAYDLTARSLVSEHCFDRYGPEFCDRYVNKTDVFEPHNTWSCDGENPQIAFRTCRKSCGYCNFKVVQYTLDSALQACRVQPLEEGNRRWLKRFHITTPSPAEVINSTYQMWNYK